MADLSLSKVPWKLQLAIFVIISLAAVGAFYYYVEEPASANLETRKRELDTVRGRIDKGLATARQLPEFRKEVAELQTRLESLKPILPDQRDAADLLRRVQTLAVQSNLTIRGFRPQAVNNHAMHAEWPIGLELEGTYHDLGMFLDRVSKFPRIINVSGMQIKGRDQSRERGPSRNTIDVNCTATTFVLIDAPAAPAGQKGAPPAPKKT